MPSVLLSDTLPALPSSGNALKTLKKKNPKPNLFFTKSIDMKNKEVFFSKAKVIKVFTPFDLIIPFSHNFLSFNQARHIYRKVQKSQVQA